MTWIKRYEYGGAKATDPYEIGLAALYERNYHKASTELEDSLREREENLAVDQKAVADAACWVTLLGRKASTAIRPQNINVVFKSDPMMFPF